MRAAGDEGHDFKVFFLTAITGSRRFQVPLPLIQASVHSGFASIVCARFLWIEMLVPDHAERCRAKDASTAYWRQWRVPVCPKIAAASVFFTPGECVGESARGQASRLLLA